MLVDLVGDTEGTPLVNDIPRIRGRACPRRAFWRAHSRSLNTEHTARSPPSSRIDLALSVMTQTDVTSASRQNDRRVASSE